MAVVTWVTAHIEEIKTGAIIVSELMGLFGMGGIAATIYKAAKALGAKDPQAPGA